MKHPLSGVPNSGGILAGGTRKLAAILPATTRAEIGPYRERILPENPPLMAPAPRPRRCIENAARTECWRLMRHFA
jgi:hypothetical protein